MTVLAMAGVLRSMGHVFFCPGTGCDLGKICFKSLFDPFSSHLHPV